MLEKEKIFHTFIFNLKNTPTDMIIQSLSKYVYSAKIILRYEVPQCTEKQKVAPMQLLTKMYDSVPK